MNALPDLLPVLLVEPADVEKSLASCKLRQYMALAETPFAAITETDLRSYLERARLADQLPGVLLVDGEVSGTAGLIQEILRFARHSNIVFLYSEYSGEAFRKKIKSVPMAGLHWTAVDVADPAFADVLDKSVRAADRRKQLRSTLKRANHLLGAARGNVRPGMSSTVMADYYLASFLAHSQDAIIAMDPELTVLYWSAGAEQLFGMSAREVVGKACENLPFWSQAFQRQLTDLQAETGTVQIEAEFETGGSLKSVESVCSAVRDHMGNYLGTTLVVRDVTNRNRALEVERFERQEVASRLERERRYLRALFEQAPGFIAITTGDQHVFEVVNDAYMEVIGRRELLGKPAREALPEMQGQEFLAQLDQVFQTGKPYVGRELPVSIKKDSDGLLKTLYIDFIFQPILNDDNEVTGIFCQGSDVTAHKLTKEKLALHQNQLEQLVQERTEELEASREALHRSQKLESIGQLTGGVAHDFNNVLQIVSSNLQLLQMSLGDHPQQRRCLNAAIDAVERGTQLSTQLLAFARRQPLQPASVNLARILRSMNDLLQRALGETVEIETVVAHDLWNTLVDPHRLENVILNLAINARDAMQGGGKLTLELNNATLDDQYVRTQPDIPPGQYVLLAVSDTGSGMTAEVLERAFDPFFSTKREGEGTGLGLSMAYGFVKQSGGHIRIYSEVGNGTTIKIYLPRSVELEAQIPETLSGPVEGGSETVLVVEDDPAVREAAVLTLKDLGYHVLKAADGQSALHVLQSGLEIDILFTDVVMPGPVRSPELARQAKQMFPKLAILFTSGYTQNAIVHSGRLDPGVELLSKPYRREDLARKLRQILSKERRADQPPASSTAKAPARGREEVVLRVLVVEDDPESLSALCELLDALGFKRHGVGSAEEALDHLQRSSYDILLTDLELPGISGLELARQAREASPSLGVIIASGYGSAGVTDIHPPPVMLPKPFDLDGLQRALSEAVTAAGRRPG